MNKIQNESSLLNAGGIIPNSKNDNSKNNSVIKIGIN